MKSNLARLMAFGLAVAPGGAPARRDGEKVDKVEHQVGDAAPTFQLQDQADKAWRSSDHFGKKWVVLDFYPGDFTPGCTA